MYITKFKRGTKSYYVAVHQARVNGKPRIIWRKYLGTAESIVRAFEGKHLDHIKFKTYDFGKAAAILRVAEELDFVNIVNSVVKKKDVGGLSVGEWLLLLILGRCHGPYSKQATGEKWFKQSFLQFVSKSPHKLNSKNFLNQMAYLDESTVEKINFAIGQKLVSIGLNVTQLVWDTTNFSTNIEDWSENELLRTGFAKDKRYDKNLVGVGIAINSDNIPLYHKTYPGNEQDAALFGRIIDAMLEKLRQLKLDVADVVLTIDCGCNSEKNIAKVLERIHVIGSLKRTQVSDLMDMPISEFEFVYRNKRKHEIKAYRTEKNLFGKRFTIIITYNPATEKKQKLTYETNKEKILTALKALAEKFRRKEGKGRKMTSKGLRNAIQDIIPKQLRSVFWYTIDEKRRKLEYGINKKKEEELRLSFGKKPLFTDLSEWNTKKIVKTYHRKSMVEDDFKWLKGKLLVPIPPFFVRKEDMVRAHIFLCILGMLFIRYLKRKLNKLSVSAVKMMEELGSLRVALIMDMRTNEVALKVESMSPVQAHIFSELKLDRYLTLK